MQHTACPNFATEKVIVVASPEKYRNEEGRNGNNPVTETKGRMSGGHISVATHSWQGRRRTGRYRKPWLIKYGSCKNRCAKQRKERRKERCVYGWGYARRMERLCRKRQHRLHGRCLMRQTWKAEEKNENRKEDQVSLYLGQRI